MKKTFAILLAAVMILALGACAKEEVTEEDTVNKEIAMITDIGSIDDKSFNQGVWEGIVAYAEANGISHEYYKPIEENSDSILEAIELAYKNGAKVIVVAGFSFEEPIFYAQDLYPEIKFVLIDGNPRDSAYNYRTNENVVGVIFAEEQAGYLAGYAAVKDGNKNLGFMGGMSSPSVIRYGYGFVQGAEAAAKEMDVTDVYIKYNYTGSFDATPEARALAESWYKEGTEIIFACGGLVGDSVMSAAEENNGNVIGVDVDQSVDSETVITSAMKGLEEAVTLTLEKYYANEFPSGQTIIVDAAMEGVSLPMNTSKFKKFTQADYSEVYEKLAAGEIEIKKDSDVNSVELLMTNNVKVSEIKKQL